MTTPSAPPPDLVGMVPARFASSGDRIELLGAGTDSFSEPFFGETMRRLRVDPGVRRLDLSATQLHQLLHPPSPPSPAPAEPGWKRRGLRCLIFHTGRCGSTLLARRLRHDRSIVLLSEPPIPTATERPQLTIDLLTQLATFAKGRRQHAVVKLSSLHSLTAPWFATAMPDVPLVFVHRPAAEVIASSLATPSSWAAMLDQSSLHGVAFDHGMSTTQRLATIWAAEVDAALSIADGRMQFVSHDQLVERPETTLASVAAHLGLDRDNLLGAVNETRYYAKSLNAAEPYDPDGAHQRAALDPDQHAAIARLVGDRERLLLERTTVSK